MAHQVSVTVAGNLGTNAGQASNGVLLGSLTNTAAGDAILASFAVAGLCYNADGIAFVNETTPFNEATTDDVEVWAATPAVDDAIYFGLAANTFNSIDLVISTQGAGTWTVAWEYWNGTAWTAVSGLTDGTTGMTAAAATVNVSFTLPTDWEKCLVAAADNAYWVRCRVATYAAVTTQCQLAQGWIINAAANPTYTDDTTDFNDAGAGDVDLLPAHPVVNDAFYYGHATERFCKIRITTSQALVATLTLVWEYWNGTAWTTVATLEDASASYTAVAGTHFISFLPPADWVANTTGNGPNSQAGFFIRARISAFTSMTTQPQLTQGWVLPISTGAEGATMVEGGTINNANFSALTASATNNDSIFLLLDVTTGAMDIFTVTAGDAHDTDATLSVPVSVGDQVLVAQIQEDGTTEFADANILLNVA